MNRIPAEQLPRVVTEMLRGMARVQARQEMLECFVRALIIEAPPLHPLVAQALRTAKSDMESRLATGRPELPPEIYADAMSLWNVLWRACEPPAASEN